MNVNEYFQGCVYYKFNGSKQELVELLRNNGLSHGVWCFADGVYFTVSDSSSPLLQEDSRITTFGAEV